MDAQFAMSMLIGLECILWFTAWALFRQRRFSRRFPMMGRYVFLHALLIPTLFVLFGLETSGAVHSEQLRHSAAAIYFFTYWALYLTSSILVYFICAEIFRAALSPLPGLMRLGNIVFHWAFVVSLIVCVATTPFSNGRGIVIISDICNALMRAVSVLDLCLLAFLCLAMNALQLPLRDIAFGFSLGFGVMSIGELAVIVNVPKYINLMAPLEFVYQGITLLALSTWVVYCALPEKVRKPLLMPVNSAIFRWNDIASALGHPETKVAPQQPANSFFLTDVEKVVEKVLTKNLKSSESDS